MKFRYDTQDSGCKEAVDGQQVKETHLLSPLSGSESETSASLRQSPKNIEVYLRPLTPFPAPLNAASPPIPQDEPENHSAMLSARFLPLPLLQESPAISNSNMYLGTPMVPHLEIPPSIFADSSALPPMTEGKSTKASKTVVRAVPLTIRDTVAESDLHSPGEGYSRFRRPIPETQEGQLLPLLTPHNGPVAAELQHNLRILHSPPLEAAQVIAPPISFARAQPDSFMAERTEVSQPYQQSSPFRSQTHPLTSASEHDPTHALHPLSPPLQPYDQAGDARISLQRLQTYTTTQQGYQRDHRPIAGPSRRWSDHAGLAPSPRGNSRDWIVPFETQSRASVTSSPKGRVRKKQGPSVKRTEIGMACEFCRRRSVANVAPGLKRLTIAFSLIPHSPFSVMKCGT